MARDLTASTLLLDRYTREKLSLVAEIEATQKKLSELNASLCRLEENIEAVRRSRISPLNHDLITLIFDYLSPNDTSRTPDYRLPKALCHFSKAWGYVSR
jgi:hypothetical protein